MGDLLRFVDPKRERRYQRAAEAAKQSIYAEMADEHGMACDTLTTAMARTVYESFYEMYRCGLGPATISTEIDDFLDLMRDNLPKIKANVWRWVQEEHDR